MLQEPTEINVGADTFRIGRLDAMKQLHVARRLGPIMAGLGSSIMELLQQERPADAEGEEGGSAASMQKEAAMLALMAPIMDVVAEMPDETVDYIVRTCLSVVQRRQGDKWAPMMRGTNFMFQDVDMTLLIRLTVEVVKENLGGFFFQPRGAAQ